MYVSGKLVPLSNGELTLLTSLARCLGAVRTREELANDLWGTQVADQHDTLNVHLSVLRKKLGQGPRLPVIQTVRGVGYKLVPPAHP